MKRTWGISTLLVVLFALTPMAPGQGQAAPGAATVADALASVTPDAWGVVCVRNMAGCERKILEIANRLGLPAMSPLMMAKGMMGLLSGVDDNGDLVLVIAPAASMEAIGSSVALLIPTTGYSELTSMMQLTPVDGAEGVSRTTLQGNEVFIGLKGKHAVLAPSLDMAKKILASKSAADRLLTPYQLKRMGEDDISIWVNTGAVLSSPLVAPLLALPQLSGAMETLKAMKSLQVGVRVEPAGVRLGFHVDLKEDSKMAQAIAATRGTDKSLLTGLPKEPFVFAMGGLYSKEAAAIAADQFALMLDNPQLATAPLDKEKLGRLKDLLRAMTGQLRSFTFGASALQAGENGMIGTAAILTIDGDAKAFLTSVGEMIGVVKGGLITEEGANKALATLEYRSGAETIGGISVDQLVVDLSKIEGLEAEQIEDVKKVIGKEGIVIRLAAADAKRVIVTFGGGPDRLKAVAETVKADKAPLAEDKGVAATAKALPAERCSEVYIALDTLVRLIAEISKVVGDLLPMTMPELNAPIGLAQVTVGKSASQTELFLPMAQVVAAKDLIMTLQGAAAPPAMEPAPAVREPKEPAKQN